MLKIYQLGIFGTCLIVHSLSAQTGTVVGFEKISNQAWAEQFELPGGSRFGRVAKALDINADGVADFVAGAPGNNRVRMLLSSEATRIIVDISADSELLEPYLSTGDGFGSAVDIMPIGSGYLLAVGASNTANNQGAAYLLKLDNNLNISAVLPISDGADPVLTLNEGDRFGDNVSLVPGPEGEVWLCVSAPGNDIAGVDAGTAVLLRCNLDDFMVMEMHYINAQSPLFSPLLENGDQFGRVSFCGDLNSDGNEDLVIGATGDDDGGNNLGAVYQVYLADDKSILEVKKISRLVGDFNGLTVTNDMFGVSVCGVGDIDGNGTVDLAVGAPLDDDGGLDVGSVWILLLNADGTVKDEVSLSRLEGNFNGDINFGDRFGIRVSAAGDLNGDGVPDILVGADQDDDGATDAGAFYAVYLNRCDVPDAGYTAELMDDEVAFFSNTVNALGYYWNFDDGNYAYTQNPVHSFESSGTYTVCQTVTTECGTNTFCDEINVSTSDIADPIVISLRVFPNPAHDHAVLKLSAKALFDIELVDLTGKLLLKERFVGDQFAIDLSNYAKGLYLISVKSATGQGMTKLWVSK